jgi:disulfide bond formation protein DsbB
MVTICCRIFSLVSDVGTALRLFWSGLPRIKGKVTVHVLLDFSKAFDFISHGLFVHKLDSQYDLHTSAMGMVSSFLQVRSKVGEVNGAKSAWRYLSSEVPQGCSPLFFLCLLMICVLVFVFKSFILGI